MNPKLHRKQPVVDEKSLSLAVDISFGQTKTVTKRNVSVWQGNLTYFFTHCLNQERAL